jgi:predicted transcriptional regulator
VSELSEFVDQAVLDRLLQKPMSVNELVEALDVSPSHLRPILKRLLRAGKIRRFRENRELIYSIAEGAREVP